MSKNINFAQNEITKIELMHITSQQLPIHKEKYFKNDVFLMLVVTYEIQ